MTRSTPDRNPSDTHEVVVADLSHAGEGVVRLDDRVFFVPGALPGERVRITTGKKRRGRYEGRLEGVLEPSPGRVVPRCEYFGVCGGCTLQHLDMVSQQASKQKILLDNLERIGKVSPHRLLPVLSGDAWSYRRKARPGCRFVPGKGGILIGFREKGSSYLTSLRHCHTLDRRLSDLLDPLHELISGLDCFRQVPQVEFAAGDEEVAVVLRHLVPLNAEDEARLVGFARSQSIQMHVQPSGLESIRPLWPINPESLSYRLEKYDVTLCFSPSDFVQVNGGLNQLLVQQAMELLDPKPGDHVLDLFCGLGNFTLPVARLGARVTGVEGDRSLVKRGMENAETNVLDQADFLTMDLFSPAVAPLKDLGCNKILLDPPRSGALEVVESLVGQVRPERIVYVSCNPATLARDAEILVHRHHYEMSHAGTMDMFPHTAHVEAMAVFQRPSG